MNTLELENFKKFGKASISLNDDELTLISGVNNSGKTSILHSLAVWEYAKMLIIKNRGIESLFSSHSGNGMNISKESFTPINIPGLKYLWKNQKTNGSYDLKIRVGWRRKQGKQHHLEISFTLNGNNFAIKKSSSTINYKTTKIPTVAYLPPFGGMQENETLYSIADRRKTIGKGQAGAVIRNILLEMYNNHSAAYEKKRIELLGSKVNLSKANKEVLSNIDTEWNTLQKILMETFRVSLEVEPFDSEFHNHIKVNVISLSRGIDNSLIKSTRRDLMIEGSGFLQWLSVFSLALDRSNQILALDEPDSHLHPTLQTLLISKLEDICRLQKKQILMVSHSSEIIKAIDYKKILKVTNTSSKYLASDESKISLLYGLGSYYYPTMEEIIKKKNVLMVESTSDSDTLKILCETANKNWPDNLVIWSTSKKHKERTIIASEFNDIVMKDSMSRIKVLSIIDLDDENYGTTNEKLWDNNNNGKCVSSGDDQQHLLIRYRTWRRREMENYLIIPEAMARYINKETNGKYTEDDINKYLNDKYGFRVPKKNKFSDKSLELMSLFTLDLKDVLSDTMSHFKKNYSPRDKFNYIKCIEASEICDDIITLIDEIISMCEV